MTCWKLTLSYDGSLFFGWQVQPGLPTVQGILAAALKRVVGEVVLPQGSGRTDAGVHALGQVASFALQAAIAPASLARALNHALPASIRVLSAEIAQAGFHARHSAVRKTYEYRIFERRPGLDTERRLALSPNSLPAWNPEGQLAVNPESQLSPNPEGYPAWTSERPPLQGQPRAAATTAAERICPPFVAPFVWDCRWALQLEAMQQAAAHLCGAHDFTSFAASDPDLTRRRVRESSDSNESAPDPVKTVVVSRCWRQDGLLLYRVTGSGFLHHMVRNLVGTLVEVGRGSLAAGDVPRILEERNRSAAGPTAPASGLFLLNVDYGNTPVQRAGEYGAGVYPAGEHPAGVAV